MLQSWWYRLGCSRGCYKLSMATEMSLMQQSKRWHSPAAWGNTPGRWTKLSLMHIRYLKVLWLYYFSIAGATQFSNKCYKRIWFLWNIICCLRNYYWWKQIKYFKALWGSCTLILQKCITFITFYSLISLLGMTIYISTFENRAYCPDSDGT